MNLFACWRGKASPSRGMDTFLTEALRRVPPGVGVRARLDSGFYGSALFAQLIDAQMVFVPYRDAQQMLLSVVNGNLGWTLSTIATVAPMVEIFPSNRRSAKALTLTFTSCPTWKAGLSFSATFASIHMVVMSATE